MRPGLEQDLLGNPVERHLPLLWREVERVHQLQRVGDSVALAERVVTPVDDLLCPDRIDGRHPPGAMAVDGVVIQVPHILGRNAASLRCASLTPGKALPCTAKKL